MWNQMGHNIENDIWLSWSKLEYSGMHSAVVPIYDQRFVSSTVNMDFLPSNLQVIVNV